MFRSSDIIVGKTIFSGFCKGWERYCVESFKGHIKFTKPSNSKGVYYFKGTY